MANKCKTQDLLYMVSDRDIEKLCRKGKFNEEIRAVMDKEVLLIYEAIIDRHSNEIASSFVTDYLDSFEVNGTIMCGIPYKVRYNVNEAFKYLEIYISDDRCLTIMKECENHKTSCGIDDMKKELIRYIKELELRNFYKLYYRSISSAYHHKKAFSVTANTSTARLSVESNRKGTYVSIDKEMSNTLFINHMHKCITIKEIS